MYDDDNGKSHRQFLARMAAVAGVLLVPAVTSYGLTGASADLLPPPPPQVAEELPVDDVPVDDVPVEDVPVEEVGGGGSGVLIPVPSNTITVVQCGGSTNGKAPFTSRADRGADPAALHSGGSTRGKAPATSESANGADPGCGGNADRTEVVTLP